MWTLTFGVETTVAVLTAAIFGDGSSVHPNLVVACQCSSAVRVSELASSEVVVIYFALFRRHSTTYTQSNSLAAAATDSLIGTIVIGQS